VAQLGEAAGSSYQNTAETYPSFIVRVTVPEMLGVVCENGFTLFFVRRVWQQSASDSATLSACLIKFCVELTDEMFPSHR
jgi:hypothetical protein